jgi:hypothetical protein
LKKEVIRADVAVIMIVNANLFVTVRKIVSAIVKEEVVIVIIIVSAIKNVAVIMSANVKELVGVTMIVLLHAMVILNVMMFIQILTKMQKPNYRIGVGIKEDARIIFAARISSSKDTLNERTFCLIHCRCEDHCKCDVECGCVKHCECHAYDPDCSCDSQGHHF